MGLEEWERGERRRDERGDGMRKGDLSERWWGGIWVWICGWVCGVWRSTLWARGRRYPMMIEIVLLEFILLI